MLDSLSELFVACALLMVKAWNRRLRNMTGDELSSICPGTTTVLSNNNLRQHYPELLHDQTRIIAVQTGGVRW